MCETASGRRRYIWPPSMEIFVTSSDFLRVTSTSKPSTIEAGLRSCCNKKATPPMIGSAIWDDILRQLHIAARYCGMAIAKLFLKRGASLDQVDDRGDTALHMTIKSGDLSIVQPMLDRGADPKINGEDGLSGIKLASGYGLAIILEMLLGVGSSSASGTKWALEDVVVAYWQAIRNHRIETLKVLVKKKRRLLDELSSEGFTSIETYLHNRGGNGEEEQIAICLLEFGTDPFKRRQADRLRARHYKPAESGAEFYRRLFGAGA